MNWFNELINNPLFIVSVSSWFIAQTMKLIINAAINKRLDWERLFGDGGMPSGHSATVSSLAAISFFIYGAGSFEFAVTAILAIIVCHDAMGVRLETGKQAHVINEIMRSFTILADSNVAETKISLQKPVAFYTPIMNYHKFF